MNNYQIQRGASFTADLNVASLIDLINDPLAPGYPRVELRDTDGVLLQAVTASPDYPPTVFDAQLSVPSDVVIDGVDYVELTVVWLVETTTGRTYQVHQTVQAIEPENTRPVQQEVVMLNTQTAISVIVDGNLNPAFDTAAITIYRNNAVWFNGNVAGSVQAQNLPATSMVPRGESTLLNFDLSNVNLNARLAAYDAIVTGTHQGQMFVRYLSLFFVTPAILASMSDLEHTLKKSKAHNIIPALNYTQSNLVHYLNRGLDWFNGYPPILTNFNGTNMQGMLRNAWLLTSTYYGLMAQALAENDLNFDFSGQSVTLRVDRSGGIESALGRIDTEMDRTIRPLKTLLGKGGVTGGDGSIGDREGGGGGLGLGNAMGGIYTGNHSMLNLNYNVGRWPWNINLPPIRVS